MTIESWTIFPVLSARLVLLTYGGVELGMISLFFPAFRFQS
jgi:hypothetical protein